MQNVSLQPGPATTPQENSWLCPEEYIGVLSHVAGTFVAFMTRMFRQTFQLGVRANNTCPYVYNALPNVCTAFDRYMGDF